MFTYVTGSTKTTTFARQGLSTHSSTSVAAMSLPIEYPSDQQEMSVFPAEHSQASFFFLNTPWPRLPIWTGHISTAPITWQKTDSLAHVQQKLSHVDSEFDRMQKHLSLMCSDFCVRQANWKIVAAFFVISSIHKFSFFLKLELPHNWV